METCLYHSDKAVFDKVQRDLRTCKWIPKEYVHRLAMAVCSCRKFKGEVGSWQELSIHCDSLYTLLHSDRESQIPPALHKILSSCITRLRSGNLEYSSCRMVNILYHAKYNDFSLLKRENVSSNKMDKGHEKKPATKQKLTEFQIAFIKRKRQRKYDSTIVKLNMFPGNKSRMEEDLTENIFDFSKKNKCYLDFKHSSNDRNVRDNVSVTYVKVWSKDPGHLNLIQKKLQAAAESAQKKMDDTRKIRLQKKKIRVEAARLATWEEDNLQLKYPDTLEKDQLAEDFEKKHCKDKKSHCKKSANSALVGGHCLQCLKPYTGLGDTSTCTYHLGYLDADGVWSCCSESYDEGYSEVDHDYHSETGCTTGVQHLWRPHAKRIHVNKVVTDIDEYVKTRHIKHRYQKHRR